MSFLSSDEQHVVPEGDDATGYGAAWRWAGGGLAVALTAVCVLYIDAIVDAVSVWNASAAHQFSYLVIPLSAYFVWLRRPSLSRMSPQPSWLGVLIAVPFGALWLLSHAAQLSFGEQLAAMGIVQSAFLAILGWPVYRALLFPLLFLWLLVPFGDFLIPGLTDLTTMFTVAGLRLSGLQVDAFGTILITDIGRYGIVAECSAFDFLIGNLVISLVFANLVYRGMARRLVYVLASVPVAILANNLRTTSIVLITELSDGSIDLVRDHQTYGWILFFMAVVGQMAVGLRFRDGGPRAERPAIVSATRLVKCPSSRRLGLAVAGLIMAALAPPVYAALVVDRDMGPTVMRLCFPPSDMRDRKIAEPGDWRPVFPAAQGYSHRVLDVDGRDVDIFVAYYWQQAPGVELIGWGNRLYDGDMWRYLNGGRQTIRVDAQPRRVDRTHLSGPYGKSRVVWSWYWVDGQMTARLWQAKLLQASAVLFGDDRRAALIAISTEESGSPDAARRAMQAALGRYPSLADWLNGVTAGNPARHPC